MVAQVAPHQPHFRLSRRPATACAGFAASFPLVREVTEEAEEDIGNCGMGVGRHQDRKKLRSFSGMQSPGSVHLCIYPIAMDIADIGTFSSEERQSMMSSLYNQIFSSNLWYNSTADLE